MITAVDTNVLLDILIPGAPQGDISEEALTESLGAGSVVISEVVYAELGAHFSTQAKLDRFLQETGIRVQPSGADALYLAGKTWREHLLRRPNSTVCPGCGSPVLARQHVLADFFIGAHANIHADRLLTRDRGYYRTYFPGLRLSQTHG